MPDRKSLLEMTDEELREGCRRTAASTEFWFNDYYREIERRNQSRHTKAMRWLTGAIVVFALVEILIRFVH